MSNLTWAQIEDFAGAPIVLLQFVNPITHRVVELTVEGLPQAAQDALLQWINNHLPGGARP